MIRPARAWFRWGLGLSVALCTACDRSDGSVAESQASSRALGTGSSQAGGPSKPPGAGAEGVASAEALSDLDQRDVRWLLRPPLRGAPLGASTVKGKEVPIPHLPGSRAAQAMEGVDDETLGEARAPEVPLAGRTNTLRAFPQNVADKPVPRTGAEPWQISEEWLMQHERQLRAPRRAEAKLVFLGDSITAGWRGAPAYRDAFSRYVPLNLGIAGDHTQNVLWRIQQGALDGVSPQAVVVMIGVNNLGGGFTPEATVGGVRAVVSAVQERLPGSRILLLGILPARHSPSEGLRSKIAEANRLLAAAGWPGLVEFRDVGAVFLDPEGIISKTVMRDFLHPTPEGYQLLSSSVEPLLSQLLRQ
ncbi:MAG TPA: GDSL-type esterase/lipase family protein [Polyangiaceae bacterium]|nr:GDSL-type esterase/lipase family protein [Polyangiaceae bacterium]